MNELIAKLEQLTLGKALVIGLIVAALYWFMSDDGAQQLQGAASARSQVSQLKQELSQLEATVREVQEHQIRIGALGNELSNLSSYISENANATELMKKVSTEAKAAGLDIMNLNENNSGDDDSTLYTTYGVQAEFKGTYSQHLLFLSFLTNLKTIVTISQFNMAAEGNQSQAPSADPAEAKLSVALKGYRYIAEQPAPSPEGVTQ